MSRTAASDAPRLACDVEGLCCAMEARQVEGKLGAVPGVERLRVDPVRHRITVEGPVPPAMVERAMAELGMKARRVGAPVVEPSGWARHGRLLTVVASGVL